MNKFKKNYPEWKQKYSTAKIIKELIFRIFLINTFTHSKDKIICIGNKIKLYLGNIKKIEKNKIFREK